MENNNSSKPPIEIQLPQTNNHQLSQFTYQQKRHWNEEFKYKLMEHLSFGNKHWEDVAYSALVWVSLPAFMLSIIYSDTAISGIIAFCFSIAIAILLLIAGWLILVVPDCEVLVLIRLALLIIGIALGAL